MRFLVAMTFCLLLVGATAARAVADGAYAPTTESTGDILAKLTAADGQLQSGDYLTVSRTANGDGTTTTWTTQVVGGDRLTLEQRGAVTDEFGEYQGQDWWRDANGTVILERGADEAITDPAALMRSENGENPFHVLGETQGEPQQYVLEAHSPGGDVIDAYVDAKTFLLAKVTFSYRGGRSELDFSDYRALFGRTQPFHERDSEDGFPQNGSETQTLSFTQSPSNDAAMTIPPSQPLFAVSAPLTLPARFTDAQGYTGEIVLTATVNGQSLDMVLDSGASGLTLDPGAARRLGLPSYGRQTFSIGGNVDRSNTIVPQLSIGGLALRNVVFDLIPFNDTEEGAHPVGLIGCDFFASSIVGFDFKRKTVTLYPRSTFDPTALGLEAIPIQTNDCVPRIAAMFENVRGTFLLDTGAFGTMLSQHYLAELPQAGIERDTSAMDQTPDEISFIGGSVPTQYYVVNDFVFASTRFRTGEVAVPSGDVLGDDAGLIGRNVLKEYVFYLDYADGLAFFKLNV